MQKNEYIEDKMLSLIRQNGKNVTVVLERLVEWINECSAAVVVNDSIWQGLTMTICLWMTALAYLIQDIHICR